MIWPGRTKVCTGPSHSQPARLPLTPDYWHFHRSGERQGQPVARCKSCTNWDKLHKKDGPHGLVTVDSAFLLLLQELVDRCGSFKAAGRKTGMSPTKLKALADSSHPVRVQKRTAQLILNALGDQRRYDREHGASRRFLQHRRYVASVQGLLEAEHGL